jgi:hypothetical protein
MKERRGHPPNNQYEEANNKKIEFQQSQNRSKSLTPRQVPAFFSLSHFSCLGILYGNHESKKGLVEKPEIQTGLG